jgi:hypothetical protein
MGKQLRNFEGRIDAVSQPRFAADRNVWVLMVKENGKWIAVVSRNEEKIKAHYDLIEAKRIAKTINTFSSSTTSVENNDKEKRSKKLFPKKYL